MKKLTPPFVLLASVITLSSCTQSTPTTTVPVTPTTTVTTGTVTPTTPTTTTGAVASGAEMTPVATGTTATPTSSSGNTSTTQTVGPQFYTRVETVSYMSPAGKEEIEFSVTVADGVITAANARPLATDKSSLYNQGNFANAVASSVVGKKAKDLDVHAIGGASLTTAAFETFVHSFPG